MYMLLQLYTTTFKIKVIMFVSLKCTNNSDIYTVKLKISRQNKAVVKDSETGTSSLHYTNSLQDRDPSLCFQST